MSGMTDELDDPFFLVTELFGFEGSLFDPAEMERLAAKQQAQPLWVWAEEWQPYRMIMCPERGKAALSNEGGREIIEQAKEEAFLAWGH